MTRIDEPMMDDAGLEALFAEARANAPEPSAELLARIMGDAEATLVARDAPLAARAEHPVTRARRHVTRQVSHWANLLRGLGGWPALASMATATVAGVWIGFASPDSLNTLSGGILLPASTTSSSYYDLEDMLPGYGSLTVFDEEVQG